MVFAPLALRRPLRDVPELVWRFLLLCGCPCASRIISMRDKQQSDEKRASKKARYDNSKRSFIHSLITLVDV